MKRFLLSLTLTFCILLAFCIGASISAAEKFTDVEEDAWYSKAVFKVNELGIMNGTSGSTFEPLKNLTRSEYVAILFRLDGGEENMSFSFTDVPDGAWYKKYVGWAESTGVITGYGNAQTFGGGELITREQLMLMTSRYMKYKWVSFDGPEVIEAFQDSDKISSWAKDGVLTTHRAGLVMGDSNGCFNPQSYATRAEIATIIVRYINKLPEAKDEMFMKLDNITEIVECRNGAPALTFSRYLTVHRNKGDVIGEQVLPQMGLDTEKYQLCMNEARYATFRDTYHEATREGKLSPGETKTILTSIYIRNVQTKEETPEKLIGFNILYDRALIDSNNYDLGLDDEVLQAAYEQSVHSTGNISRIAKIFQKAENGEDLTVGYIGGSLTSGGQTDANISDVMISDLRYPNSNWALATTEWLKGKFPDSNVRGINAAIGGTNSLYGLVRTENELFRYDPDIIFIEYSSNDYLGEITDQSLEALIRTCLTYKDDVAVIIALCHDNNEHSRSTHLELAEYYSLPVIDLREGVFIAMEMADFSQDDFTIDGCHPNTWGHHLQAAMAKNFFMVIMDEIKSSSDDKLTISPLPTKMLYGDRYMGMDSITFDDDAAIDSFGSWKKESIKYDDEDYIKGYYENKAFVCRPENGNDPLEFTFTGTDMYIFLDRYSDDADKAGITVTLNDGEYSFEFLDSNNPHAVFSGLEAKEYKVKITLTHPENNIPAVISSIIVRRTQ